MHISQQQEQFSRAYVHAIASVAGFTIYTPQVDDDSVDLGIAQWQGNHTFTSFDRSPRFILGVLESKAEALDWTGIS